MPRKPEHTRLLARARYRRWRCRCRGCWQRATFPKPPHLMKALPACKCRGKRRNRWFVDWSRQLRKDKARWPPCQCHGREHPHRPGSCQRRDWREDPEYLASLAM